MKKGFTIIEVLLSTALVVMIAGIMIPVCQSFQTRNELDIIATTTAQTLRRAQILAQASDGDISWGVYVQRDSLTLFKGASYLTRDVNYDEILEIPISITPSGLSEIVFTKFNGLPQTTGVITLTANSNEARNITINAQGLVSY